MRISYGKEFVDVSEIDGATGRECWIHNLEGDGGAIELMVRAKARAKELGYTEVWANVANPRLAKILADRGWSLEQVILKGET